MTDCPQPNFDPVQAKNFCANGDIAVMESMCAQHVFCVTKNQNIIHRKTKIYPKVSRKDTVAAGREP
jgi:hypothetical protein